MAHTGASVSIWQLAFWKGAAERAVRAFAAAFLALMVGGSVGESVTGVDLRDVGWLDAASYGGGAALVSLLLSVIANLSQAGPAGSASMVFDRAGDDPARAKWKPFGPV